MTTKPEAMTEDNQAQLQKLEKRIAAVEKHLGIKPKRTRRTREYTTEEKAAIRARLKAGQDAARKKREGHSNREKKQANLSEKTAPPADKK